jgi:scyllo-inositol 2-dehydrogenase (NADP+)
MIRLGLVGLGKMGLSHLAILRAHPDLRVVAVCDTFGVLLKGLNDFIGLQTYASFEKMLDNEKLDAVLIATPSRFHGPMVRQALNNDLHVFCEKPFCLDIDEGKALAELAKKKGLVNQVGYHYRFVATFAEAKRLLTSNLLGRVHHIRAEAYGPVVLRPKGSTWRSRKSEGGGCLYDYASHAIDLVSFLYCAPDSVEGTVLKNVFSTDVDDEVYTTFRFSDGATGQLAANWSDESFRKMSMLITVWGTNGHIRVDRQEIQIYLKEEQNSSAKFKRGWNSQYITELTEPVSFYLRGEEYSMQIDNFVCCIKDKGNISVSSFETALQTDVVVTKMIQDARRIRGEANEAQFQPRQKITYKRETSPPLKWIFGRSHPH